MASRSSDRYRVHVTGDVSGQVITGHGNVAHLHQGVGREPKRSRPDLSCVSRSIVVVDVQGSGRLSSQQQARMRADLVRICGSGVSAIGQPWADLDPTDLGDGLRFLMPPESTPPARVLDEFAPAIEGALRDHTAASSASGRVRLRMAVHFGFVDRIDDKWSGEPLVHAARLVDAAAVKQLLREAEQANLALVVSDDVYQKVVRQGHARVGPAEYQRIDVAEKELSANAWVRLA